MRPRALSQRMTTPLPVVDPKAQLKILQLQVNALKMPTKPTLVEHIVALFK